MITLSSIPGEVVARICFFLDGPDVLHLAQSCKHLKTVLDDSYVWHTMVKERFGDPAGKGETDKLSGRELYFFLERRSRRLPAKDQSIIWSNGHYWKEIPDETSDSKTIMHLDSVCFLDVRGELHGVRPGTYKCVWRMRLPEHCYMPTTTTFTTETMEQDGCAPAKVVLENEAFQQLGFRRRQWFDFNAGQITLKSTGSVKTYIINHSDIWKSGFELDYFELQRIPEKR
eukprot:Ihof_evm11s34 gene=Ihof_evmTU11s34